MTRQAAMTLAKVAVSVLLLGYLASKTDLEAMASQIIGMSWSLLLVATLLGVIQVFLIAFRWRAVLRAIRAPLSFRETASISFVGFFLNQFLPSLGGDAVRMYRAYRSGLEISGAVNGVMLERLASVLALTLMVAVLYVPFVERTGADLPVAAVVLLLGGAVAGMAFIMLLDRAPTGLRKWRLVRGIGALAGDCRRVFLKPLPAFACLGWAAVGNLNFSLLAFVLALGLGLSDQVTLFDCVVLVPPVILAGSLPITVGGWGVREGAMMAAFSLVGVSAEHALAISLLFGLVTLVAALPGGLLWLTSPDRKAPASLPETAVARET